MHYKEKELIDTLIELRENHHAIGIKTEFEDEGTRLEEAISLSRIAGIAALNLTIKIGGCGALNDMGEARTIGVSRIVAPMIETPYALRKFLTMSRSVFPCDESVDLCVNIETIDAYKAFDQMLAVPEIGELTGIVLGRVDLVGSMGLDREQINSSQVYEIAYALFTRAKQLPLECAIGGGIGGSALPFLRKIPIGLIDRFETRNVIFKFPDALDDKAEEHIMAAVRVELLWLRYKRDYYARISARDTERIAMLEARYKEVA
jgi:4-hydroxy-2-oxoheptanedioate aldolase